MNSLESKEQSGEKTFSRCCNPIATDMIASSPNQPFASQLLMVNCETIRVLGLAGGFLEIKSECREHRREQFVPISFTTRDGCASISFRDSKPIIRLETFSGPLMLTADGVKFWQRQELKPFSDEQVNRIATLIATDTTLQHSLLTLRGNFFCAVVEAAAIMEMTPNEALVENIRVTTNNISNFLDQPTALRCTTESVVEYVTEEIWNWVNHITTALEQAQRCASGCLENLGLQTPLCLAACAVKVFVDIVTSTWELIETITKEVVKTVIHCVNERVSYPTLIGYVKPEVYVTSAQPVVPGGEPVDPAAVQGLLGPIATVFECLINGKWSLWRLDNFGVELEKVREVPIGVRVCIDRACTDKIFASILNPGFAFGAYGLITGLISGVGADKILAAIAKLPAFKTSLEAIAGLAGLTASQAVLVILGLILLIAYQVLAVAGQIKLGDLLGYNKNGICLNHPAFVIATIGVVGSPLAGLTLALNTPIIVQSRD